MQGVQHALSMLCTTKVLGRFLICYFAKKVRKGVGRSGSRPSLLIFALERKIHRDTSYLLENGSRATKFQGRASLKEGTGSANMLPGDGNGNSITVEYSALLR